MKTVAYYRKSKEEQDIRSQEKRVNDYCTEHGIKVHETISDAGSRDLSEKRPNFQRLLTLITSRKINTVIIAERDRLGFKDAYEYGHFIHLFRMNGVKLICVAEEGKDLTADDRIEPILACLKADKSQNEQIDNADRNIRGKVAAIKRGEWNGGKPPLGYDSVARYPDGKFFYRLVYQSSTRRECYWPDGRVERFDGNGNVPGRNKGVLVYIEKSINQEQIDTVKEMFKLWNMGHGVRSISNIFGKKGQNFNPQSITGILTNPSYVTGVPCWNKKGFGRFKELIGGNQVAVQKKNGKAITSRRRGVDDYIHADQPNPKNAIITQKEWDKAQARFAAIKAKNKPVYPHPDRAEYYYRGLLHCGGCGAPMIIWGAEKSYRCSTHSKLNHVCHCNRTPHEIIDRTVVEHFRKTIPSVEWLLDQTDEFLDGFFGVTEGQRRQHDAMVAFHRAVGREFEKNKRKGQEKAAEKATDLALEKERDNLVRRMGLVDDRTAAIMAARIKEITTAIEQSASQHSERKRLRDILQSVLDENHQAQHTLKRETIERVIGKITVHYSHVKRRKNVRTTITSIEIAPRLGGPSESYVGDSVPRHASTDVIRVLTTKHERVSLQN